MEKIDAGEDSQWCDDDELFDLGLEKFGTDLSEYNLSPNVPKRKFCCWVEDWEKPLLSNKNPVAHAKLLEKYKGLRMYDHDNEKFWYSYGKKLHFYKGRERGWALLAYNDEWDGNEDIDTFEKFLIRHNIIGDMVMETEQPKESNIEVIKQNN